MNEDAIRGEDLQPLSEIDRLIHEPARLNLGWLSGERLLAVCDEVEGFFAFVRRARATLSQAAAAE